MPMSKAYNPSEFEDNIYQQWEQGKLFNPDEMPDRAEREKRGCFSIVLPPPNVTGTLHLGHASMLAIEDLFVRYKRMKGFDTVWIPGTDHAAIATQNVVEKKMYKNENKTRHDLGREKFLAKVDEHVQESKNIIKNQVRKMGSSLDWSREAYTLDETRSKAVRKVFKQMYDEGLIYRGDRVVNWCPRCHSTLADDEVEYKEQKAKLYTFKYSKDFPFTIATTRPETKLGDTAVAVNPKDERYKKYIGQELETDFCGVPLKLKIIGDWQVDMEFGTGALGVTPAHSMVDWAMAEENDLNIVKVIDEGGNIRAGFNEFSGKPATEAGKMIIEKLREQGLLEKEEELDNKLSICYRCGTAIEPLPSKQWFVSVNKKIKRLGDKSLKERAVEIARKDEIKFIPDRFKKAYSDWMENLHDWCISRQIWFGHRIPVWYDIESIKNKKGILKIDYGKVDINELFENNLNYISGYEIGLDNNFFVKYASFEQVCKWIERKVFKKEDVLNFVSTKDVSKCDEYCLEYKKAGLFVQDPDTLDTWFSSGLWTFSTLLPEDWDGKEFKSSDIDRFHPNTLMETGYDILFFWVARMILMTSFVMEEIPFENVFLHGLVRDRDGQKMSKSRPETAIDPLEAGEKYGFDAVRLSMLIGNTAGNDIRLYDEKIEGYRNFVNKLWNISRFVLEKIENPETPQKIKPRTLSERWIMSRFNELKAEVDKLLENYNFSQAGELMKAFTWDDLADWYLEITKVEENDKNILAHILRELLQLWHPFTPFVTQAIWNEAGFQGELMIEKWPPSDKKLIDRDAEKEFEKLREVIVKIRNLRSEYKVEPAKKIMVQLQGADSLLKENQEIIKFLVGAESLQSVERKPDQVVTAVVGKINIYLPLSGLLDFDKEKQRLEKEIIEIRKYFETVSRKLQNKEFVKNAPKQIVETEKKKATEAEEKLKKLQEQLTDIVNQ